MMTQKPKVSIGLAVYNGEKYLKEAIDSILAQSFTDFELIISDNASTDCTEKICRSYAANDRRIKYFRNETNIGGINNENKTFSLSSGEYFRFASHDDYLNPYLLEKSVKILDDNLSVVLCYSSVNMINESGKHLQVIDYEVASSPNRLARFCSITTSNHSCDASYGLMRSSLLHKIELQPNYPGSDYCFLAEISIYGQFYQIPEPLYYRRLHPEQVSMSWYKPSFWGKKSDGLVEVIGIFLHKRISVLKHFHRIISRSPLVYYESFVCYLRVIWWLTIESFVNMVLSKSRVYRHKLGLKRDFIRSMLGFLIFFS